MIFSRRIVVASIISSSIAVTIAACSPKAKDGEKAVTPQPIVPAAAIQKNETITQYRARRQDESQRQLIVGHSSSISAGQVAASIAQTTGEPATLRYAGPGFAVIELSRKVDDEYKKLILKSPGVKYADRNRFYQLSDGSGSPLTQQDKDKDKGTTPKASETPKDPLADPGYAGCSISERCTSEARVGVEKLWAQLRLDADLMQAEIQKNNLRSPQVRVNVGVIDSGFDSFQLANVTRPVTIKKGKMERGEAGDPTNDQAGHGTMVTGTIVGKDGIGAGPNSDVTVYRVTEEGDSGSTSDATLIGTLKLACDELRDPDGITLLNLSWGEREDEMGLKRDETTKATQEMLKEFAEKGCLVFKAAGNSNFLVNDDSSNGKLLDDPYLRVAAIDTSGELARFSSTGEVAAPGHLIYSLFSTKDKDFTVQRACHNETAADPKEFISGTSFSTPFTAAIASEVVGILKSGTRFSSLVPADRIKLVNRILKASMQAGTINGLRCARLASVYNSGSLASLPSVSELEDVLNNQKPAECQTAASTCSNLKACDQTISCFQSNRWRTALCSDDATALDLALTASQNNHVESSLRYFHQSSKSDTSGVSPKIANNLMQTQLFRWAPDLGWVDGLWKFEKSKQDDKTKFNQDYRIKHRDRAGFKLQMNAESHSFFKIFPEFVKSLGDKPSSDEISYVNLMLDGIYKSSDFERTMGNGLNNRGAEEQMERLFSAYSAAKGILSPDQVLNSIKTVVEENNANAEKEGAFGFLASPLNAKEAAILNALLQKEEWKPYASSISALEDSIFNGLDKGNVYYSNTVQRFVLMWETPKTRDYFDPLMSRHQAQLAAIGKGIADGSQVANQIGPVKLSQILNHTTEMGLDDSQLQSISSKMLKFISQGQGWTERFDTEFLDSIDKLTADGKGPSTDEWKQSIENSTSLVYLKLAGRNLYEHIYEWDMSPIMGIKDIKGQKEELKKLAWSVGSRLVLTLTKQDPQKLTQNGKYETDEFDNIFDMVTVVGDLPSLGSLSYPVFLYEDSNRVKPLAKLADQPDATPGSKDSSIQLVKFAADVFTNKVWNSSYVPKDKQPELTRDPGVDMIKHALATPKAQKLLMDSDDAMHAILDPVQAIAKSETLSSLDSAIDNWFKTTAKERALRDKENSKPPVTPPQNGGGQTPQPPVGGGGSNPPGDGGSTEPKPPQFIGPQLCGMIPELPELRCCTPNIMPYWWCPSSKGKLTITGSCKIRSKEGTVYEGNQLTCQQ